jgi:hypothetical protein
MTDSRALRSSARRSAAAALLAVAPLVFAAACSDEERSASSPTAPPPTAVAQPQTAVYEVTFEATWTRATHPVDFPTRAHFSPLVGGTHDARVAFWDDGRLASEGIERMAENGRVSPLDLEIQSAIRSGTAEFLMTGAAIDSPGRTSLRFTISQRYPLVTLVTMVAPSPDWFVGTMGLDLFAGGVWAEQVVVPLVPWDAGTDHGTTFTSEDVEARPHAPISLIRSAPLAPDGLPVPMGTFTFRRVG